MNDLALVPTKEEMSIYENIAKYAYESKYFDKLGGMAGVMCIALRAREMGISPFEAIYGGFSNVQGKMTMSSDLMGSLIRRAGHKLKIVRSDQGACVIQGTRADTGETYEASFTMQEARSASLVRAGSGWEKYPSDMLYARCISRLRRRLFQDIATKAYVEGEIEDEKASKAEIKQEPEIIHIVEAPKPPEPTLSIAEIVEIEKLAEGNESFLQRVLSYYKAGKLSEIEAKHFEVIRNGLLNLRKSEGMEYATA